MAGKKRRKAVNGKGGSGKTINMAGLPQKVELAKVQPNAGKRMKRKKK